ncbi:MAG: fluoride efflux transporter CrcB [Halodesulfurarchaeum sp.]
MVPLEPAHLVGAGGVVGALLRDFVSRAVDVEEFPLGTVTVNVLGTFGLGLFTFAGMNSDLLLFFGVGAMGSFTTFSSFAFETVRLWETGERARSVINAVGTLVGAGIALGIAWVLVQLF